MNHDSTTHSSNGESLIDYKNNCFLQPDVAELRGNRDCLLDPVVCSLFIYFYLVYLFVWFIISCIYFMWVFSLHYSPITIHVSIRAFTKIKNNFKKLGQNSASQLLKCEHFPVVDNWMKVSSISWRLIEGLWFLSGSLTLLWSMKMMKRTTPRSRCWTRLLVRLTVVIMRAAGIIQRNRVDLMNFKMHQKHLKSYRQHPNP